MDTSTSASAPARRSGLHPLTVVALVSVIAFSGVGIAAMLYNNSQASDHPAAAGVPPGYAGSSSAAAASTPVATSASAVASAAPSAPTAPSGPDGAQAGAGAPPGYGSGTAPSADAGPATAAPGVVCHTCATVTALNEIKKEGEGTGLGAVGGGVLGGILGNQFGRGNGKTVMTVAGVVGGAVAGNEVEKNVRTSTTYQMTVRFADGHTRKFASTKPWPYAVGSTVRVVHNKVEPAAG